MHTTLTYDEPTNKNSKTQEKEPLKKNVNTFIEKKSKENALCVLIRKYLQYLLHSGGKKEIIVQW